MASIKEHLSQKITSEAQFRNTPPGVYLPLDHSATFKSAGVRNASTHKEWAFMPWWLARENARIQVGVYEVSSIMNVINSSWAVQYAVHISTTDRNMVAYTPSTEAGEADKQVTTTFGRFLRKHFITLTDNQIQDLEQLHRGEVFAVFKTAKTKEEIERVYRNMVGDSACMRYSSEHFGFEYGVHPSNVYAAPGIGVAYTEDESGAIKSRAVVYVNPKDASDKRFVRLYGDPVLGRLLLGDGYAMKSLTGVNIRRVRRDPTGTEYVVPYLDGPGGRQDQTDGAYVVDEGDPDYLRLVDASRALVIRNKLGVGFDALARNTSAVISVRQLPNLTYVSDLTGITHKSLETEMVNVWLAHAKRVGCAEISEVGDSWTRARVSENGSIVQAAVPIGTPTFKSGYSLFVDNEDTRVAAGFRRLSAKYYPNHGWENAVTTNTPDGRVLSTEAVLVLPTSGEAYFTHVSEILALRKSGYVNTTSGAGCSRRVISKARPTARRTVSGTWFDTEYNEGAFVELLGGGWVSKKYARELCLFGSTIYLEKGQKTGPIHCIEAFKRSTYGEGMDTLLNSIDVESDVALATAVISRVEAKVLSAMRHISPNLFQVRTYETVTIGEAVHGQYTLPELLAFVRQAKSATVRDSYNAVTIERLIAVTDSLMQYVGPRLTELNAFVAQKEMEAAGQLRLDSSEEIYALAA